MKDINKANFTAFKRYVLDIFREEVRKNRHKKPFEKTSITLVYTQGVPAPSGLKWSSEDFIIDLKNPANQTATVRISNDFLKDWLCDLSYIQVDTENLKESWNKIVLDTFFERIKGVVSFE